MKLETLQPIGAFKIRGATYAMSKLSESQKANGVVTCSTGNHGRGVAYAGNRLGIRTTVCMSELVPENKVAAIRELGADVRIIGISQDEAEIEALRLVEEEGLSYLPPFDHPDIIAGQGTIGLEILHDLPDADIIFGGLSGGGLLAGIGVAMKAVNPDILIYGVTMENGAAMMASLDAGKPVQVPEAESYADSLGGGIGLDNAYTFEMIGRLMDKGFLVDEKHIATEMAGFIENEKWCSKALPLLDPQRLSNTG